MASANQGRGQWASPSSEASAHSTHSPARPAAFEPDPLVFDYARRAAVGLQGFRSRVFAELLLFPKHTRQCPDFYRAFALNWSEYQGVPANLQPCTAAAVLHVIVSAMRHHEQSNSYACFLAYQTIGRRAHVSTRTVGRVMSWQRDAPAPLLQLTMPEASFGIRHKGLYRFTLIVNPIEFARERDRKRLDHVTAIDGRWNSESHRPTFLALQQQLLRDELSQDEYDRAVDRLQDTARGQVPRRALSAAMRGQVGRQR